MSIVQMMLNELSAIELSANKYEASLKMGRLLDTIKQAIDQGVSREVLLDADIDINSLELSKDYYIYHWRNEIKNESEMRASYQFFNSILNRLIKVELPNDQTTEFIINEKDSSKTLLKCYQDEHIALSFTSKGFLDPIINGRIGYLAEDGNYFTEEARLHHISEPEHLVYFEVRDHIIKINKRNALQFNNGTAFWNKLMESYPTLVFCNNVEKQVKSLDKKLLMDCARKLIILEQYFSNWDWVNFEHKNIPNTTPESASTLSVYEDEHTFETPFGESIVVSYHIKGGAFDSRVYFHIDYTHRKVVICSIGEHLPCVTYGK